MHAIEEMCSYRSPDFGMLEKIYILAGRKNEGIK